MSAQFITGKDGKAEYAIVPISEYEALCARAMDQDDLRAAHDAEDDEELPWDMAKRLIAGENPVRVWREFRDLTQAELAEAVGNTASYISQIEAGRKSPTIDVYRALAAALRVTVDDLLP